MNLIKSVGLHLLFILSFTTVFGCESLLIQFHYQIEYDYTERTPKPWLVVATFYATNESEEPILMATEGDTEFELNQSNEFQVCLGEKKAVQGNHAQEI